MNTRKTGAEYEELAAQYLRKEGYQILEQNYKSRFGEIDILADKEGELIVVEVKYRSTNGYGDPLEAVDRRKQKRICQTLFCLAFSFTSSNPLIFDIFFIFHLLCRRGWSRAGEAVCR